MQLYKKIITVIVTLMLTSACDNITNDVNISQTAANKPKVALIMKSLANEFFVNMDKAAINHQLNNAERYQLISNGIKNESDLAQQVNLIYQMIAMQVDAIVICPADSKALVPALAKARDAGIIIINIDNRLSAEVLAEFNLTIPFIGPSNEDGAKQVADFALKDFPKGSQVAIIEGITTATNSIKRRTGFEKAILSAELNLVTVQSASWDQTKAAQITSAIISQYPDLKVILAANDNMALGAASAVGLANLDHHIAIAGFDNISAIHPLIEQGIILATAEQYGDKFAIFGIELALEILKGTAVAQDRQTPVDLVTKVSLAKASGG